MSELERNPLVLTVSADKFVKHVRQVAPNWWEESGAARKGTYPLQLLVSWHCSPEGVKLTLDPWLWMVKNRYSTITLVEYKTLEEAYEAERNSVAETAADEARCKAWKEFPSFKRWQLLRELADTPK